jgi:hypothetical protein
MRLSLALLSAIMLSVAFLYCYAERRYADCSGAKKTALKFRFVFKMPHNSPKMLQRMPQNDAKMANYFHCCLVPKG